MAVPTETIWRAGHVHVFNLIDGEQCGFATCLATESFHVRERSVVFETVRCLGDNVAVLVVSGQVFDRVGHDTVLYLPVRRLKEAEGVDAGEGRERADKTNVRAFRGLDRTHTACSARGERHGPPCRRGHGQDRRAECRRVPVRQSGERVVLIHELRQLGGSEELLDRGNDGTDVDQRGRRDCRSLLRRHPLADHTVKARQAGADLVLDELANGANTTVAKVVDVVKLDLDVVRPTAVRLGLVGVEGENVVDGSDNVLEGQLAATVLRVEAELLVDLVATNLRKVVALIGEVEVREEVLASARRRRFAGAELAVDVGQRLFLGVDRVLLEGVDEDRVIGEFLADLLLGHSPSLEENGHRLLTLTVDADANGVTLVDLELEPGATRRDELRGVNGACRMSCPARSRSTHRGNERAATRRLARFR